MSKGDIEHVIDIEVQPIAGGIEVVATYARGSLAGVQGALVAKWPVRLESPNDFDPGHLQIGDGRIEIEIPELRRLGLGSLFMALLIEWIKKQPSVPVEPINLKASDAQTIEDRESRNRFYEKFGFTFEYKDDKSWGESRQMRSADLLAPDPTFPKGWSVDWLS